MIEDLDMLGAEGLAGQYIVLRVRGIDRQKLGRAVGSRAFAAALPAALAIVDFAPQQLLPLLAPAAVGEIRDRFGVDLEYQITDAPPAPGQGPASRKGGGAGPVLLGVALGALSAYALSHYGLIAGARSVIGRIF